MKKWLLIIPLAAALAAGAWLAHALYQPFRGYSGKVILQIQPGAHVQAVAEDLVRHGVLAYRLPFLLRYWWGQKQHETLKYGEYLFDQPQSALEVYGKLVRGQVYLHTVLIPEGSDRFDMARICQHEVGLAPQAFLTASTKTLPIRALDPNAPTLEGYLFPDTYRFPRGVSGTRVVETMVGRFRQVYDSEIRSQILQQGATLHDVMTLASLVEKETPNPVERPVIAGVFTRRLQLKMPLQCDPTVVYAIRLGHRPEDPGSGPLTSADLAVPSPYNTYSHPGLPPGPICSPGLASILAALHPAPGKALYFVSNTHGGHVFAKTLTQQNRNVVQYRRRLKAAGESKQEKKASHPSDHPPFH
jgi:UPF0755 protein